jgi:hypothetical protein
LQQKSLIGKKKVIYCKKYTNHICEPYTPAYSNT